MKNCILHVRSTGCDAVVHFRVTSKYRFEPEALEDRLRDMMNHPLDCFEVSRVIGDQGVAFYTFKVPHGRLFDSQKEGLLGALAQVEREVQAAVEQKKLLNMVEQS